MNTDIMEYMVEEKQTMKGQLIRSACFAVVPVCLLWFFFGYKWTLFIILVDFIVAKHWLFPMTAVEYEYLYCDRKITVDKILGKAKRVSLAEYELDRMEIIAPLDSHRLDSYKGRQVTTREYWSHRESDKHKPYAIYYEGNQKIVLDLPDEFVKMVQNNAPRKVFMD